MTSLYQCSVKSSLNCSICIDFHMITSNINAKISSNNNTNPKLWINDFMILNFEYDFMIVKIQLFCMHERSTFKLINIYWVCLKSKTLCICWFSPSSSYSPLLFLILHHFSRNSEQKNIFQTIKQLMQFG